MVKIRKFNLNYFKFIVFFYIFKPALCFYKNSNKLTTAEWLALASGLASLASVAIAIINVTK